MKPTISRIEPSHRWVRARLGDAVVVDCKQPMLVWEHPYYPTYFFPRDDVRMDWLQPAAKMDGRTYWNLLINNRQVDQAAYHYEDKIELESHIALQWNKLDRWFEEDEEVFVHARDPFKRVDAMPSSRHVRVVIDGATVAETKCPLLIFETTIATRYYIPAADVNMTYLTPTDSHTRCPYKGVASYWSVSVGKKIYEDQVWSYPDPIPECPKIDGLYCFYNTNAEVFVDGELQKPST